MELSRFRWQDRELPPLPRPESSHSSLVPRPLKPRDRTTSFKPSQLLSEVKKSSAFTRVRQLTSSDDGSEEPLPQMWTPFVLRRRVLLGFAFLFLVMIIALEVILLYTNRNNGLTTSDPKKHYFWTYGPTAVLTLVAASWSQVEYRTKQLMPWKTMSEGPTSASRSLGADFVSPFSIISIFKALKISQHMTTLIIAGTFLIELVTVASTGLFDLQSVTLEGTATDLVADTRFDGGAFDPWAVDGTPAMTVAGLGSYNLTYPLGTTDKYAFPPFNVSGDHSYQDSIATGLVDVLSSDLDCEQGELVNFSQGCETEHCEQTMLNGTVKSASCSESHASKLFRRSSFSAGGYFGELVSINCTAESEEPDRLLAFVAHWTEAALQPRLLVCKPTYHISKRQVSLRNDGSVVSVGVDSSTTNDPSDSQIPNISPMVLVNSLLSSVDSANLPLLSASRSAFNYEDPQSVYFGPFFQVANISSPLASPGDILQYETLEKVTRGAFSAIIAQIARENLMSTASQNFPGTVSAKASRLFMQNLSLRVMEAALAVLIVIACVACIFRTSRCTPQDPGTIAGLATILARSPEFSKRIRGVVNAREMKQVLATSDYQTVAANGAGNVPSFSIEPLDKRIPTRRQTLSSPTTTQWWRPFSVRIIERVFITISPLVLIVALEAVYQVSKKHDGLLDVNTRDYTRYLWDYIPATVMLGVKLLFDSVDFTVKIFQPYLELRRVEVTGQRSMTENHMSKLPIQGFLGGVFNKQYAISASAFAMLVAPFLTIAVSGLYSSENVSSTRSATIRRVDFFNSTIDADPNQWSSASDYSFVGGLVVNADLPYPAWTYDELAFPKLDINSLSNPIDFSNGSLSQYADNSTEIHDEPGVFSARIPALRGGLDCKEISNGYVLDDYTDSIALDTFVGTDCGDHGGVGGTMDNISVNIGNPKFGDYFGKIDNTLRGLEGCPKMISMYGRYNGNDTSEVKAFVCSPYIEEVQVDANFTLPTFQITSAKVDESSATIFAEGFKAQFDIENFLVPSNRTGAVLDAFYTSLVYRLDTLTLDDFNHADQFSKIYDAAQHLYRTLAAQQMSSNLRIPAPALSPEDPNNDDTDTILSGTITDPTRFRLKQSLISTRVLEALLATMFICVCITFAIMKDTREVLPQNPCTIAGAASLLAGSDVADSEDGGGIIPAGAEWWGDKELVRKGVFDGLVFSLGWWDDERVTGGRRYGVGAWKAE
ncbi:hypothetical protein FQN54_004814 [Arachnomyces sp. PD_36]|nr:hypothetical protein FQN54_004814 [Arachnomyces sp. PD_36]